MIALLLVVSFVLFSWAAAWFWLVVLATDRRENQ